MLSHPHFLLTQQRGEDVIPSVTTPLLYIQKMNLFKDRGVKPEGE